MGFISGSNLYFAGFGNNTRIRDSIFQGGANNGADNGAENGADSQEAAPAPASNFEFCLLDSRNRNLYSTI